jgi:DNA polymerase I
MNLAEQQTEKLKVIDAEYSVESGHKVPQPVVHLFCRDGDRNYRQIDVEGFRPYFMMAYDEFVERTSDVVNDRHVLAVEGDFSAVEWDEDGNLTRGSSDDPESVAETLTETANGTTVYHESGTFDALDGTKLVKVFTVEPGHVGKIRDHWEQTWEADVPFTRRFLISSGIHHGVEVPTGASRVRYENWNGHSDSDTLVQEASPCDPPEVKPRMLVVDIEVRTNGGGVPDPADSNNEITAITSYDNYEDEYAGWILTSDQWEREYDDEEFREDVKDELDIDLDVMTVFDHETQMVEDFHEWVLARNFDLATGWNSNGFDYPYIIQRSYNISAFSIRDWDMDDSPFNAGDEWPEPVVDGLVLFDMLDAYKKTQYRDLRSYKLEDVAQAELDMGKIQLEESLDDAWHKQPIEFMRYNVRDVEAVVEIEQSSALLDLYDNMRQVTGALYNTCNHNGPMLDTLFLRQAYDEGIALTTNYAPEQGDYPGAKVFEPVPGVHENVVYPDLACFTPDTEVVTPDGVVSITDLDVGDIVYSINPETGAVTEKSVTETHEYPEYDGELVDIESTRADFRVTPNHQMVFKSPYSGDTLRMEAGSVSERSYLKFLSEWEYTDNTDGISTVHIPDHLNSSSYDVLARYSEHGHAFRSSLPDSCTKKRANYHNGFVFSGDTYEQHQTVLTEQSDSLELTHPDGTGTTFRPIEFDGDDFIEFIGWYITEGSVYDSERDRSVTVQIAQEDDAVLDDVAMLLERNGIEPHIDGSAVSFSSPLYAEMLTDLCGDDSASKTIPDFVFEDASIEQKKLLLDTLLRGDGHNDIYYTSSDQLAEDVVRLCVETGHKPIRRKRDRTTENEHTEWEIQTTHVNDGIDPDKHVSESTADNGVYCVTVEDNHTLLAGRNGKFQWVGQSLYPYIMWTLNISPETLYESKDAYRSDGYSDDDMFTAYIDDRDWKVVSSGDNIEPSKIDKHKYKGVHDETGSRKKKKSQGFDGIFEPLDEDHPKSKTEIYYVKPDVKEGFIRKTVDLLVDLKYRYKGQGDMYAAVKRVTNSLYGTLGDSASGGKGFRLFDWRLAESITNVGRMVIEYTADEYIRLINEYAEEAGYESETYLVAGDTDSVMSSIPQAPDYQTALSWAEQASEEVSGEQYDTFMEEHFDVVQGKDEHKMDVEIESLASKLFFIQDGDNPDKGVKKRYAQHMIWDEDDGWLHEDLRERNDVSLDDYENGILSDIDPHDHIGIKGFEYVRSDSATVTKDAQLNVLTYILLADDPEDLIYEYLNNLRDSIYSDDFDVAKLGRPKGISNELDEYGWKSVEELENDTNYTVTERDEERGGRYVSTPSPAYRGAKYADDHIPWEDIGAGAKPIRFYVDKVRGDKFPAAYEYEDYPQDEQRGDPPEVGRRVDAIAVEDADRVPREFVLDKDKMVEKELKDKIQPILRTIGEDWDGLVGEGRQTGLSQWT